MSKTTVGEIVRGVNSQHEVRFDVPEHAVYLSFNSDWHAVAFRDWLTNGALETFETWARKREDEYRWL